MKIKQVIEPLLENPCRVTNGKKFRLKEVDPGDTRELKRVAQLEQKLFAAEAGAAQVPAAGAILATLEITTTQPHQPANQIGTVTALLMALTAICTAWCSYKSAALQPIA